MYHKWSPIRDLQHAEALANAEIDALALLWQGMLKEWRRTPEYAQYELQLARRWAIETGLIERLYTLDEDITQLLIERGIEAALIPHQAGQSAHMVAAMIGDHKEAVDGIFDFVKGDRRLTTSYVKELHALMTRHQEFAEGVDKFGNRLRVPLRRGAYKLRPNNPLIRESGTVHEYCPPEHVASEMDNLIAWHHQHMEDGVAPEVEAAWLHHRFTQIHPFQDGNGRIARALATLVFLKAGWFPLVVLSQDRSTYIGALEAADRHQLRSLVEYLAKLQKTAFVDALQIAQSVRPTSLVLETIQTAATRLRQRQEARVARWPSARQSANALHAKAHARLAEVAEELQHELTEALQPVRFLAEGASEGDSRSHYFRRQITESAKALGYVADFQSYRTWSRLVMENADRTELLVSIHGIGSEFRGILACTASLFQRTVTDDNEREVGPVTTLSDTPFLIGYNEPVDRVLGRYSGWLEEVIALAIIRWQETLL